MPSSNWTTRPNPRKLKNLVFAITALVATSATGYALADGGGVTVTAEPKIRDVHCLKDCAGIRSAAKGSVISITGRSLSGVAKVGFASGDGRITVSPRSTSVSEVKARVPVGAKTGTVKVTDELGRSAVSDAELKIVPADEIESGGGFKLLEATARPKKAYFGGTRQTSLSYLFSADHPTDLRVDVSRRGSGKVVRTITIKNAKPSTPSKVVWDGRNNGGAIAANGKYRFKLTPMSGPQALSAPDDADTGFSIHDHKFPVRGRHEYGDGLGAGRNHQGQDVFAKCGTPLQAARGGRVQFRAFHEAAGYYVVIDGTGNKLDYVYMHLRRPSPLRKGQRVKTGQYIGDVGESGNASGCHLHFELWQGDWYNGGHVVNPTTSLKAWDRWS